MPHALCRRPAAFFALAAFALAGFAGCGSESMYKVEGKVKYKDKVLTKGTVILRADAKKDNNTKHEPRGSIEADGTFKIFTHPHEGAPPGWYKVEVISTEPSDPKNPYSNPKSVIPEKFGKANESGLVLQVRKDAEAGAYDLELK